MIEKALKLIDKGTIRELEKLLRELKGYYTKLNETYSIRDNLVELNDKRRSLAKRLNAELTIHNQAIKALTDSFETSSNKLSKDLTKLESSMSEIADLKSALEDISDLLGTELSTGEKYQDVLLRTLNIDKIQEIIKLQTEIKKSHEDL
ncbi:MAG: hypothetical protein P8Y46_09050, partial [Sulfurovaceae bacterium]